MNVKAMMFAGGGLMASMVATTVWISNDMAQIAARERAKEAAQCAAQQAAVAPAPAPAVDPSVAPAPTAAAPTPCSTDDASPAGNTTAPADPYAEANGQGAVGDPYGDGQVVTSDPYAQTGDYVDPAAGSTEYVDPAGTGAGDPSATSPAPDAGTSEVDAATGQPITF